MALPMLDKHTAIELYSQPHYLCSISKSLQMLQTPKQVKTHHVTQLYLGLHLKYTREALGRDTCTLKLIAAVLCGQDVKPPRCLHQTYG